MNLFSAARYGIGAIIGASLMWVAVSAYNTQVAFPRIAHEARQGFVLLSEKVTAEAQLAEERRLRTAAELARTGYSRLLADLQARQAEENERIEQEISDYEAALQELGRACHLNSADIEWLRQPGS